MGKNKAVIKEFKCPFCGKLHIQKWRIINHIRMAKSGDHGSQGEFPQGFNPQTLECKPRIIRDVKPLNPENNTSEGGSEVNPVSPSMVKPEIPGPSLNLEVVDMPKKEPIDKMKCPDCGSTKADWMPISQLGPEDPQPSDEEKKEYQFVCTKCKELIKVT